jgi:hypothetical protein
MPYVYSTLTCSTDYYDYEPKKLDRNGNDPSGNLNIAIGMVTIKGGANVPKAGIDGVFTPRGIATKVTDEQLEFLLRNEHFKEHVAKKFIQVDNEKMKPDKFVRDNLQAKDLAAPKIARDLEEETKHLERPTKEFKKVG